MKIVYFGYNALSSCLDYLIQHNHEIIAVYTGEDIEHTDQILHLADQQKINVVTDPPQLKTLQKHIDDGVECFICAEYPFVIPIPKSLSYAFNIHPTLLPEGRGKTPLPLLILNHSEHAGITFHKMSDQIDRGDILLQLPIVLAKDESFDSLSAKIFIDAPILLEKLLSNIEGYYLAATSQAKGSYWAPISIEQQSISWHQSISEIELTCRAFSSLGVKITINQKSFYMTHSHCVSYEHLYTAGDVIQFDDFKLIIALKEGFIIIPRACLFEL